MLMTEYTYRLNRVAYFEDKVTFSIDAVLFGSKIFVIKRISI